VRGDRATLGDFGQTLDKVGQCPLVAPPVHGRTWRHRYRFRRPMRIDHPSTAEEVCDGFGTRRRRHERKGARDESERLDRPPADEIDLGRTSLRSRHRPASLSAGRIAEAS